MCTWWWRVVYLTDGRLTIDNHPAEQAIRPLAVGRRNWLHIGADGGMTPAAVLLSMAASAKRHRVNPWEYFKHILTEMPARPPNADLTDLLPDEWAKIHNRPQPTVRYPTYSRQHSPPRCAPNAATPRPD